jgi:hypothetical protein
LITLFFSISPEYETVLKDEFWGCFKHIGIPIDVVMKLPVQERKFFILKHNQEQEEYVKSNKKGGNTISGENINTYANIEQANLKNRGF